MVGSDILAEADFCESEKLLILYLCLHLAGLAGSTFTSAAV